MRSTIGVLAIVGLAAQLASAGAAHALPPLSQDKHVNSTLLSAAIGDQIRKKCPTISPRMVRVFFEAQALKAYARDQGYSEARIEAFIDSKEDKRRIKAQAAAWLEREGAREGDPQSYCTIGTREIARGSLTGRLLKAE